MGLQLVLGGSGSGKSEYLYSEAIERSMKNPDSNIIVVVPEQYTMETQKKLVLMHPRKGILNIDVVSFERLAYKVFEEIGGENRQVLDDTGKNLIIRRVLETRKKQMRYFGNIINKTGFVSELKSVISEMLQYDIGLDRLEEIRKESVENQQLNAKLDDISVVYAAFKDYMSEHYITSEEILDVLCSIVEQSALIKRSEIIFDGFTGFTPIQYKLLRILLSTCKDIKVSVTIDARERANVYEGMHNLFFMSKDMIQKLHKLCEETQVEIKDPVVLGADRGKVNPRFQEAEDLAFLEKNLFRYKNQRFLDVPENIRLYEASVPKEEIQYAIGEIIRLTRQEKYHYREIALVTGDIAAYGKLAANMMAQNDIPVFLDNKRSITDNPFVEMIRSALEIMEKGYSYDSMFRYLRTGMTGIAREDVDLLENYCLAVGIRGSKSWREPWTKKTRNRTNAMDLEYLNQLRMQIIEPLIPLEAVLKFKESSVRDYVTALYYFLVSMRAPERIDVLSELPETGNEYDQLYKKVMELFDKIVELLGDETVSVKEFNRIMDAGFEEIKVGLIPPTSDCVVIGDIERTRLDNIKIVFFVGVNDGIVPKKAENRSVLSETDRDFLEKMDVTLSPSTRQKAFIQKFYLYLIMTKASRKLYVSYARKSSDGKSLLPSYLIRSLRVLFPKIQTDYSETAISQLKYIRIPKNDIDWNQENYIRTLSDNAALALYGDEINGSISAFEKYASCRFAYFLQYGLRLEEREEYSFAMNDFGTVMHAVLEDVSRKLEKEKRSFTLLTEEERHQLVLESVLEITKDYGNTILTETSRNEFLVKRITDLAERTVWTIGKQLAAGEFAPDAFEMPFIIDEEKVAHNKKLSFRGKIDRIDVCEDEDNVYVKVIDYKSGNSDFDLLKTYYGLKLQLIMYMRAAMHIEQKRHPDKNIIPAGILYYNIDNPIIELTEDDVDENGEINQDRVDEKILEALRMKGVVNDNQTILKKLDDCTGKSLTIPIAYKTNGDLDARRSKVMNTEKFDLLEKYVSEKSISMTNGMFEGKLTVDPYEEGERSACDYCAYHAVCGFAPDLEGSVYRHFRKLKEEAIWKNIREGVDEDGKQLD